jgi:uncharacterized repeat protein (TIGR03809 family)
VHCWSLFDGPALANGQFMPAVQGGSRRDDIARKWLDLAERRLAYFSELYRSGRWKRYYNEERFALRMLDVIRAAKLWGDLAGRARPEQPDAEPPAARDDHLRPAA